MWQCGVNVNLGRSACVCVSMWISVCVCALSVCRGMCKIYCVSVCKSKTKECRETKVCE